MKIGSRQYFIVFLILLLCFGSSQAETLDVPKIAEKALAATVYLEVYLEMTDNKNQKSFGSGFFVSPSHIVTNYHLIAGTVTGTVNRVDVDSPTKYTIQTYSDLVAVDQENDLALLQVVIPNINPLPLGDSETVKIGEPVYVTGNPQTLQGTFSDGIISGIHNEKRRRFQITAPISPGSSGGPVLNKEGKVIGIAFATIEGGQNLNLAIPSEYVKALLEKRSPNVEGSTITAETYYNRGNMYISFELYEAAILAYDAAIHLDPDNEAAYLNRAVSKLRFDQYWEAADDLNTVIRLNPNAFKAYHNLGALSAQLDQFEDAIAYYDKAIGLSPGHAISYASRGAANFMLGRYTDAILDYTVAIHLDPNNAGTYRNRGMAYSRLDQYAKAMSDLDMAIRLDPDNAQNYNVAGAINVNNDQYTDAIDHYNAAILRKPDLADAYRSRGAAKMSLDQHAKAIDDYNWAIFFNPDDAEAYFYRGVAKWELGQKSEAQQDWRTVLKLGKQAGDTQAVKWAEELLARAATGELGSINLKINVGFNTQGFYSL